MQADYLILTYWQVALAALLILVNGAISVLLRLKLEGQLLLASVRTVVQLLLVGYILQWVFAINEVSLILLLALVMAVIAAADAIGRTERRYRGIWFDALLSMWASSWLITGIALAALVQPPPWELARYAIPLLGMILGNTLNGISLGLERFGEEAAVHRYRVETLLALGATRWEAAQPLIQSAVRTGMIPIINSMMIVGIVSLPGMMTGQLLSGVPPMEAVKYQIVIMFLIAAGTGLGTISVVLLAYRRLFSRRHQFLYTMVKSRRKGPGR